MTAIGLAKDGAHFPLLSRGILGQKQDVSQAAQRGRRGQKGRSNGHQTLSLLEEQHDLLGHLINTSLMPYMDATSSVVVVPLAYTIQDHPSASTE